MPLIFLAQDINDTKYPGGAWGDNTTNKLRGIIRQLPSRQQMTTIFMQVASCVSSN